MTVLITTLALLLQSSDDLVRSYHSWVNGPGGSFNAVALSVRGAKTNAESFLAQASAIAADGNFTALSPARQAEISSIVSTLTAVVAAINSAIDPDTIFAALSPTDQARVILPDVGTPATIWATYATEWKIDKLQHELVDSTAHTAILAAIAPTYPIPPNAVPVPEVRNLRWAVRSSVTYPGELVWDHPHDAGFSSDYQEIIDIRIYDNYGGVRRLAQRAGKSATPTDAAPIVLVSSFKHQGATAVDLYVTVVNKNNQESAGAHFTGSWVVVPVPTGLTLADETTTDAFGQVSRRIKVTWTPQDHAAGYDDYKSTLVTAQCGSDPVRTLGDLSLIHI